MSTWMYDRDMDKEYDRISNEREKLRERLKEADDMAIEAIKAVNDLVDRLMSIGNVGWLMTHPNATIRRTALGKYAASKREGEEIT